MMSKIKGLAFACAVFAFALTPTASAQKAGQSFDPIINSELSSNIPALLTLSAIEADARKIADQSEADRLYNSTQVALKGKRDDGDENAEPTYKDVVALLQFYILQGRWKENRDKIKNLGAWLELSAQQYSDASGKNPDMQARTAYLSKIGKFVKTDGTDGISELIPLKEKLKNNRDALANVDLLVGYSLALSSSSSEGVRLMNGVTNLVSIYGRLAQKLTEALIDFGLDADGNATGGIKPGAETKLTYCVQIARGMTPGPQNLVMSSAIFIWSKANANKSSRAPNFLKDGFPGIMPVESLRERDALTDLSAQRFKEAAAAYRKIAASFPKSELGMTLDQRVWDIELANYQKNGQLTELETAFMEFRERYQGKRNNLYPYLVDSYRKSIDQVLDLAVSNNMSKPLQNTVAQVAARYARIESDKTAASNMKFKIAQIYRGLQMYKEAVDLYVELAKEQPLKYYLLAIEAQSQLAAWPALPNLAKVSAERQPERTRLLSFYEIVNQLKKGDDWFVLAHIGALNRALGQAKVAETLWIKALKENSTPKIALDVGGTLLNEFYAAKRWDDVIDLSHLFASRKQTPTLASKPLNYKPWLADALFKGGSQDLTANNFGRSVKYLEEFVQVFPTDPRAATASYSLAFGYKGLNKLPAALNVCKVLVEKFTTYPLRGKVLLQAGDWAAADRANWEFAFYFYGKYLTDYKKEANVPQIRLTLADLYMKRKLYGWASRLYKEQSLAAGVPKDQQLFAAVKAMEIEDQFGEAAEANRLAPRVIDLASPTDPARFKAFGLMGRFAANSKDMNAMNAIEAKLLPLNKGNKDVVEALGMIRFKKAELMTKSIVYSENNLTIKDPEAVVKKYFDRFDQERRPYQGVCQVGMSSYCAPSLFRLVTVAKQAAEALEKVTIAETLGPNRVNSFKVLKQVYASKIQQSKKDYISEAMRLAKQGTTTSIWKEEIIKNLEYEQRMGTAH